MLSIGEFSNICKVTTKTLRYYAEIGLILPDEINPENGYRYYSIEQLERMLFINRLKSYNLSLEEIKTILDSEELQDEQLYLALSRKKIQISHQLQETKKTLDQLDIDLLNLKQGKSIMSYIDEINVKLVEIPKMHLLSIRKMVQQHELPEEYSRCFSLLLKRIQNDKLTILAPPMVLFHSEEFSTFGLDIEFALPIKENIPETRDFFPGLCLKTILHGSYSNLSAVYTKQRDWAEKEGYVSNNALYEVYVTDPSVVTNEKDLITEIYYPIKKKA